MARYGSFWLIPCFSTTENLKTLKTRFSSIITKKKNSFGVVIKVYLIRRNLRERNFRKVKSFWRDMLSRMKILIIFRE